VGRAVAVATGLDVTVGREVSVAEGNAVGGIAVQVGAGATVAAVLQADRMKAAASAIPVNLRNFFLVCMIHTLSLVGGDIFFYSIIAQMQGQQIFLAFKDNSNETGLISIYSGWAAADQKKKNNRHPAS